MLHAPLPLPLHPEESVEQERGNSRAQRASAAGYVWTTLSCLLSSRTPWLIQSYFRSLVLGSSSSFLFFFFTLYLLPAQHTSPVQTPSSQVSVSPSRGGICQHGSLSSVAMSPHRQSSHLQRAEASYENPSLRCTFRLKCTV